jgi:hypothetical protein
MRTILSVLAVLAFLLPNRASGQDSSAVNTLSPGTRVRYRLIGDTSKVEGRIVGVDPCIGIGPLTPDQSGGFLVVSMSAVQQLEFRRRSTDSAWVVFPERALAKLRECQP